MATSARNDGIQMLLQAEKKAADKVAEAKISKFLDLFTCIVLIIWIKQFVVTPASFHPIFSLFYFIGKAKRVLEAKADAEKEMEFFRKEYERKYKIQEDEVFGRQNNIEAQITAATQKTLDMQNESVRLNRESTLQVLLDTVLNISPHVHVNYRPKQKV